MSLDVLQLGVVTITASFTTQQNFVPATLCAKARLILVDQDIRDEVTRASLLNFSNPGRCSAISSPFL